MAKLAANHGAVDIKRLTLKVLDRDMLLLWTRIYNGPMGGCATVLMIIREHGSPDSKYNNEISYNPYR